MKSAPFMDRFLGIFSAVVMLCAAQNVYAQSAVSKPNASAIAESASRDKKSLLNDFDDSIETIAERVAPAVVQVSVSGIADSSRNGEGVIERQRGIGSGVIVDPNGYIITNAHVVTGARRIRVILSPITTELVPERTSFRSVQRVFEAKLVGTNRFTDLAVLKIDSKDLPFLPLKESFRLRLGQTVLAIGSPEGLTHTVTMGIVSTPGRQTDPAHPMIYVQTDAAINPGNSGGPLVDREGNLVGINTFIYSRSGGSEGIGFAVPQPTVRFVYEELKNFGHVRRNVIGANAQTVTPVLATGLRLSRDWGVVISDVLPEGPAEKAGLRTRDIVQSIDSVLVDSLPKFTARLYLHPHSQPIVMVVERTGELVTLQIQPVDAPAGVESLADLVDPQHNLVSQLGVFVLDLSKQLESSLPEMRSAKGVIVVGKVDYVPSIETDLVAGDVIQALNSTPISSSRDLKASLQNLKSGDAVVLTVERQGMFQFISFEME